MSTDKKKKRQDGKTAQILSVLAELPENRCCADCQAPGPCKWASTKIGAFLCIRCAGIHRNLGPQISKIKSLTLDSWTPEQVEFLQEHGNRIVNRQYLVSKAPQPPASNDSEMEEYIRNKYEAKKYDGKPKSVPTANSGESSSSGDYPDGLKALHSMGFDNKIISLQALRQVNGSVEKAVELLVSGAIPAPRETPKEKSKGKKKADSHEDTGSQQSLHKASSLKKTESLKTNDKSAKTNSLGARSQSELDKSSVNLANEIDKSEQQRLAQVLEKAMARLAEFGFTDEAANRAALKESKGNVEKAANILVEHLQTAVGSAPGPSKSGSKLKNQVDFDSEPDLTQEQQVKSVAVSAQQSAADKQKAGLQALERALTQLRNLGFTDELDNKTALKKAQGNIQKAIQLLEEKEVRRSEAERVYSQTMGKRAVSSSNLNSDLLNTGSTDVLTPVAFEAPAKQQQTFQNQQQQLYQQQNQGQQQQFVQQSQQQFQQQPQFQQQQQYQQPVQSQQHQPVQHQSTNFFDALESLPATSQPGSTQAQNLMQPLKPVNNAFDSDVFGVPQQQPLRPSSTTSAPKQAQQQQRPAPVVDFFSTAPASQPTVEIPRKPSPFEGFEGLSFAAQPTPPPQQPTQQQSATSSQAGTLPRNPKDNIMSLFSATSQSTSARSSVSAAGSPFAPQQQQQQAIAADPYAALKPLGMSSSASASPAAVTNPFKAPMGGQFGAQSQQIPAYGSPLQNNAGFVNGQQQGFGQQGFPQVQQQQGFGQQGFPHGQQQQQYQQQNPYPSPAYSSPAFSSPAHPSPLQQQGSQTYMQQQQGFSNGAANPFARGSVSQGQNPYVTSSAATPTASPVPRITSALLGGDSHSDIFQPKPEEPKHAKVQLFADLGPTFAKK